MKSITRTLFLWAALLIPSEGFTQQITLTEAESAWIAEHPVVRVGVDPQWRPIEFVDDQGVHRGFSADYIALFNERFGMSMQSAPGLTWPEVLHRGKARELDVFSCVMRTPEREQYMTFTDAYITMPIVLYARKETPGFAGLDDLQQSIIAVVNAYAQHDILKREHPELDLLLVDTIEEGMRVVAIGKADVFVGGLQTGSYVIQNKGFGNIKVAATTPYTFEIAMAVRKDWPDLANILNKGIRSITQQERTDITNRWIAVRYDVDRSRIWWVLGWVLVGAIIVSVVVGFWIRQMRRREERFRSLLESTPDGMVIVNRRGEITLVNARTERLFGYPRQDLIGQKIELLIPAWFREQHPADRDHFFRDSRVRPVDVSLELIGIHRDGSEFPVEVGLSSMQGASESLVCAAVRDITDRKQTQAALAAAEERGRLLLESVGEGILGMDVEDRITFLNPVAAKLLGYERDDLLGRPVHATIHHSHPDGSAYPVGACPMHRACTKGVTVQADDETLWRKDGSGISVDCTAMPIRNQDRLVGAVITFRDISDRKAVELALKEQTEELQRLVEQREAKAAEDSSLGGLASRLQGDLSVTEVAERALDRIGDFLDAPVGVLFVLEEDGRLHRCAGRALPPEAESWTRFAMGSGSIGQVAQSQKMSLFNPEDGVAPVAFGFGRLQPKQIVTCPLVANESLAGVMELCLFSELSNGHSAWLSKASRITATALRIAQEARERAEAEERIRLILQSTGDGLCV